jgi:VWFA-related protein
MSLRITALVLAAATGIVGAQSQAPQQPTFKAQVEYVEVDALVTDAAGKIVRDLKKEDFQVLEDGKPQTVTNFSFINIPIEHPVPPPLGAKTPIEPDVQTNERPFDGRLYVMIIDDYQIMPANTARAKVVARQFIEKNLASNDLMAVVHTKGATKNGQEFTGSKRLLLAAVDATFGDKMDSPIVAMARNSVGQLGQGSNQALNDDAERTSYIRRTLSTIAGASTALESIHGRRKSILLVSEGIDYNINDPFTNPNAGSIIEDTRETLAAATRANVAIYGIDPRGLTVGNEAAIEFGAASDAASGTGGPDQVRLMDELRLSQDSLRVLSDNTGGFAVLNQNSFKNGFDRIVEDNSSYYVLAYYPPGTDKKPGKFHKIEVKVNRSGVTIRSRNGYATPKNTAPPPDKVPAKVLPEVHDALNNPLPQSGLTLRTFAAPFKGNAPNESVLVVVELVGSLKITPKDSVQVSYRAVDVDGKIRGGNTLDFTLPENVTPETRARVAKAGLRLTDRMDLPPGRYQVRFAARDTMGGNVGSVTYDLDVPDFRKGSLSMSGLLLTSPTASVMVPLHPDAQVKDVLPAQPAALRQFPSNDEIALFAEVYDNQASSAHKVDITATLTSDDGKVVFKTDEERSSTDIQGKSGGYGFSARIPLAGLPPGNYVVGVEARSRLGKGDSAKREVQVIVTPPVMQDRASGGGAPSRAPAAPVQQSAIMPRSIEKGGESNIDDAKMAVIRNAADLRKLWQMHAPDKPLPAIDFSKEMVVAVFLGSKPTAGYGVEITGARDDNGALVVEYHETAPARDAMTAQVLTMPYAIAAVPARQGDVKFEKR